MPSPVLGTFVLCLCLGLGLGEPVEFDFEAGDGSVTITRAGGDTVAASNLRVVVDGTARPRPGAGEGVAVDRAGIRRDAGPPPSL
ncbi:MAG: hypothetical protein ABEJ43_09945 [Haloferacaceae archaeon]